MANRMGRDNMGMFAEANTFVNVQIKGTCLRIIEITYLHMDHINECKWPRASCHFTWSELEYF